MSVTARFGQGNKNGEYRKRHGQRTLMLAFGAALLMFPLVTSARAPKVVTPTTAPTAVTETITTASKDTSPALVSRQGHFGTVSFENYEQLPQKWQAVLDQSKSVKGYEQSSGKDLYDRLTPQLRAAVLNLFAKSEVTVLPDGSNVLSHLLSLNVIHRDRIFATTDSQLAPDLDASAKAGVFYHRNAVDAMLHHADAHFVKYGSYKTHDRRGNLDITMSHDDGGTWHAEVDIDYFQRGLRHFFFEVTYNHAFHTLTNPFEVERILEKKQGIDPPYTQGKPQPKVVSVSAL